ncbi:hypothetical protein BA896_003080 [Janthinobacterium lividum]|uniref:DUF4145 domain-containing protein n=1 Tax=Janthinobacterium lividum TaxID=29581 RepID=A0A1E8PPH0_9BURK|nr:hypothetical protein BA896_003080 [Janthinobacterium lividum]
MHDDAATQLCRNEDWFEPEHSHYVFTGVLRCGNCNEIVIVSGDGIIEEDYGQDGREYVQILTPRFFYPPLKIIEPVVSSDIPDDVIEYLEKASQVFWCDADSCVNRLRTVIEYLLDGIGVERTTDKGVRIFLGNRIKLLVDPKHLQVKEALTSIKHMGNDGSHGSIGIERHELLLAFNVVKYCLEQLFPKIIDNTKLLSFVKTINDQEGFRPKQTK